MAEKIGKESKEKNINPHKGHREKVRKRYFIEGIENMPDHNILEFLLFFGIPYKDTNVMAHNLISHFGSFTGVLEASASDLLKIKGMTENAACLISLILPVVKRYKLNLANEKPEFTSVEELAEFLRNLYLDTTDEQVYVMAFDAKNKFLGFNKIGQGDIASCRPDLRALCDYLLSVKAYKAIIAHNHPHCITVPSRADIEATKEIYRLLANLKIKLINHIIVNETTHFSMAENYQYAHIFSGLEKSPYEKDYDEKLAEARAIIKSREKERQAEKIQSLINKIKENETIIE